LKPWDGLYVFVTEVWNHLQWNTSGFVQLKAHYMTAAWGFIALELGIEDLDGTVKRQKHKFAPTAEQSDYIAVPQILSDIVPPLLSMHQEGWAHRDLKMGNILIFQGQERLVAKLGDLGLACKVGQGSAEGVVTSRIPDKNQISQHWGTMNLWPNCTYVGDCGGLWLYMPPEPLVDAIRVKRSRSKCTQRFTRKSDVWMLGTMLAKLVGLKQESALETWGLGWAVTVANQQLAETQSAVVAESDLSSLGSNYKQYALSPPPLPTIQQLDQKDAELSANGCLKALIHGMLKPESQRLYISEVNALTTKWINGSHC